MKLVAGAGKPSEPHSLEAMVDFEMRKTHLNALALVTRLEETLGSHQSACQIACVLVDVTRNLPRRGVGATLHFERADIAVELGSAIAKCVAIMHGTCRVERLIVRADIDASALIPAKVAAREGAVIALAGVADRNMGRDLAANQPTEETTCAICRISGEPLRLQPKTPLGSSEHGFCRFNSSPGGCP